MTRGNSCPACKSRELTAERAVQAVSFKGLDLQVDLHQMRCDTCAYVFETPVQHDENIDLIRSEFKSARAQHKKEQNLLTGQEILQIRKNLDLTQQEASTLFGGGFNAFSKYENEEVVQSTAMDRLLRMTAMLGLAGVQMLKLSSSHAISSESAPLSAAAVPHGYVRKESTESPTNSYVTHAILREQKGSQNEHRKKSGNIFRRDRWSAYRPAKHEAAVHKHQFGRPVH